MKTGQRVSYIDSKGRRTAGELISKGTNVLGAAFFVVENEVTGRTVFILPQQITR